MPSRKNPSMGRDEEKDGGSSDFSSGTSPPNRQKGAEMNPNTLILLQQIIQGGLEKVGNMAEEQVQI